jgi:sec-independent protein translocase protein TatB
VFGIGGTELLVIIVVALIVFGPKDLPKAMRSARQKCSVTPGSLSTLALGTRRGYAAG